MCIFRYSWCRMPQIIPSLRSFLSTIVKTIEFFRVVPWGKLQAEACRIFCYLFFITKVSHYGFEDSNMIKSLQYSSPSIFYSLTWPDLKKNSFLFFRNGNFLIQNNQRTRIPRWLGREIVADWPSSPRQFVNLIPLRISECLFAFMSINNDNHKPTSEK